MAIRWVYDLSKDQLMANLNALGKEVTEAIKVEALRKELVHIIRKANQENGQASGTGSPDIKMIMGSSCAVATCFNKLNVTKRNEDTFNVIYHPFPRIPHIRKLWVDSCGGVDEWSTHNGFICSEHFTLNDYDHSVQSGGKSRPSKRRLKKFAVPTQKLGNVMDNKRETYSWPVIDKVYAQWKDHSWTPVNDTTVVVKQETEDSSVSEVAPGTRPCFVNLSLNNELMKEDSKAILKMMMSKSVTFARKSSILAFKQKKMSAVRKESPGVKKKSPAVRKESSTVKKERSAAKKESSAVKKESSAVKKESSAGQKRNRGGQNSSKTGRDRSRPGQNKIKAGQNTIKAGQIRIRAVQNKTQGGQSKSWVGQNRSSAGKKSPVVKKESPAVKKESPSLLEESSTIVKKVRKRFGEKSDASTAKGMQGSSPVVKLRRVPEILSALKNLDIVHSNKSGTVYSEGKADMLVTEAKLDGQVVCVNLGKQIMQGVQGQTFKLKPANTAPRKRIRTSKEQQRAKQRERDRLRVRDRRAERERRLQRERQWEIEKQREVEEQRATEEQRNSRQLEISLTPESSKILTVRSNTRFSAGLRRQSKLGVLPLPNVIEIPPEESPEDSQLSQDSKENCGEMIPENVAGPDIYEVQREPTVNMIFEQEKSKETTLDSVEKHVFEGQQSKETVVIEKKRRRRLVNRADFVVPVRRTGRIPVKKKFLGDYEGPESKRKRRSLLVKTPSAGPIKSPPQLSPAKSLSPVPIRLSTATPYLVPSGFTTAFGETPSLPARSTAPVKTPSSLPVRTAAIPAKTVEQVTEERCFVCDKTARVGVSVHGLTGSSKIHIHEKLDKILGVDKLTLKLEEDGVLCSRCALLLNYVDRIEVELSMLNKAILNCMRPKCVDESKVYEAGICETTSKIQETVNHVADQEKPLPKHVCRICRFKTAYKSLMIFHLRQHLKINSYRCDFCNGQLQASEATKCLKPKIRKKYGEDTLTGTRDVGDIALL